MAWLDWSPIDARLAWAEAHRARVRDLAAGWAAAALRTDTTLDRERGVWVYRAEVVGTPPADIALALGDVLHHARATLDNLVGVLRGGATEDSAFPITTDAATFDKDPQRKLAGVPAWARAPIRMVQPFANTPWRGVGEALARLHKAAILDRHRALLLSGALIDIDRTHAATSDPGSPQFGLHEGGRVLTLEYPADAHVTPHTAADVIVREPILRWPDGYPEFPSGNDVAENAMWAVRVVVDLVRQAEPR
jgi:hypothetical protein